MEFERAYCCVDSGIVISGATSVCGNNKVTLTAVTDCCNTITWSNGATGLTTLVSAGTYFAVCDGKQSNSIIVTHTGTCSCVDISWTLTGYERCINNISQQEQISNCGNYRFINSGNICNTNPCISVKFQSILNAPVTLTYQCNGSHSVVIAPLGCVVVSTRDNTWDFPDGVLIVTLGGTCTQPTYTALRSQSFTKTGCASGCTGTTLTYTQTYTSYVNQLDADIMASGDSNFGTTGQNYVNTHGQCTGSCLCTPVWVNSGLTYCNNLSERRQLQIDGCGGTQSILIFANDPTCPGQVCNSTQVLTQSANFTKNNCGTGCTPQTLLYSRTVTINSGTYCAGNLTDANNLAIAAGNAQALSQVNSGGQSYVNTNGTCTGCPGCVQATSVIIT